MAPICRRHLCALAALLDDLEAQVERTGDQFLRCLYELEWKELDTQAMRRFRRSTSFPV